MKWLFVKAVLVVWLFMMIVGFVGKNHINDVDFDTFVNSIIKEEYKTGMVECSTLKIKEVYGINKDECEGCVLYMAEDTMDVREILVIKASSESQIENFKTSIEQRLERQKQSFDGYGVEQTKLLNDSIIKIKGKYVMFVVNKNTQQFEKAFDDVLTK